MAKSRVLVQKPGFCVSPKIIRTI